LNVTFQVIIVRQHASSTYLHTYKKEYRLANFDLLVKI
jgi:hypothetical protein